MNPADSSKGSLSSVSCQAAIKFNHHLAYKHAGVAVMKKSKWEGFKQHEWFINAFKRVPAAFVWGFFLTAVFETTASIKATDSYTVAIFEFQTWNNVGRGQKFVYGDKYYPKEPTSQVHERVMR